MAQVSSICTNCFQNRTNKHKCEHCGWEELPQPSKALPYRTTIYGQYIVGRLLQASAESLSYIAYDTKLNRLILLVEFFPADNAKRGADAVLVEALAENEYEQKKEEFIHLGRTRLWIEEPNIQRLANYFEENNTAFWILSWHSGNRLLTLYPQALTEEETFAKTYPIFVALKVLHERGLVLELDLEAVALEDEFGSEVLMTIGKFADEADKRHDVRQAADLFVKLCTGNRKGIKNKEELHKALIQAKISEARQKALLQALSAESYAQMHDFLTAMTGEKQIVKKEVLQTKPQLQNIPSFSAKPIEVLPTSTMFLHEDEIPEEYLLPKPPKKTDYRSIGIATLGGIGLLIALGVWIWLSLAPKRLTVKADGSGKYKTIEAALKEAGQDATIYVSPGVYKENLVLAKPIKLIADNEDGEVIIEGTQKPALTAFAPMGQVKGFTFRAVGNKKESVPALLVVDGGLNFEDITVSSKIGPGLRVSGQNTNPSFNRLVAKDNLMAGVLFDSGAKGMVENLSVYGNGGFGVHLMQGANPIFRYGKISYNYLGGVVVESAGGTFAELEITHHEKPNVQIAFDGNPLFKSVEISKSKQNGVHILEGGKGIFDNCKIFENVFAGINVVLNGAPILKNSKIYDGKDVGAWFHEQSQGYIENSEFYRNAKANIRISTGANPTFKNNIVRDGYNYGIFIDEKGKGNLFEMKVYGNKMAGININTEGNPVIKNSEIFNGLEAGILVVDKGLGQIENSKIYGNAFQNVHISYGANPTFRRNQIFKGKSSGVWVEENGLGQFQADSIYGNQKSGIGIRTNGAPTFKEVIIQDNQSHGVWVAFGGSGTFINNTFRNNNGFGIYAEEGTTPTIQQNKYEQNKYGNLKDNGTKKETVVDSLKKIDK